LVARLLALLVVIGLVATVSPGLVRATYAVLTWFLDTVV